MFSQLLIPQPRHGQISRFIVSLFPFTSALSVEILLFSSPPKFCSLKFQVPENMVGLYRILACGVVHADLLKFPYSKLLIW